MKGLAPSCFPAYNCIMPNRFQCATNRAIKWIRVIVSLAIIGAGIYFKNWLGLLGIITLLSAFTGSCPLCLRFGDTEEFHSGDLTDKRITRNPRNDDEE